MMYSKQHKTESKSGTAVGVMMTSAAYHAMMFQRKQESGQYDTVKVKCFCGADDYTKISDIDRYSLKYSLCMCNECGILYANPRMTEDSYKKFYKEDYRVIYGSVGESVMYSGGHTVKDFETKDKIYHIFDEYGIEHPKTIFEIGCGGGRLLKEFDGLDVIGVDYDETVVNIAKESGINVLHGGIEMLEQTGKKADLIIMNHVLEHFLNLEDDLLRIRKLLSDTGVLFVTVPGLYGWNKDSLLQNAHTYQFTANTLEYVMRCCGFDDLYLDDNIESYWVRDSAKAPKSKKPKEEIQYILSHLSLDEKRLLPPMKVNNKFSLKERRDSIKYAISSGMKEITSLVGIHKGESAVIVAGGSTIDKYPEKILKLKNKGYKVFAIERMYKWCLNHKIVPDYVIALDASDDVLGSFSEIHEDTTHLILAQCREEVIDRLKDYKSYFFVCEQKGVDIGKLLYENGFKKVTLVSPGGSVALGAMSLALTLGCDKLHIFGFDCHITDGEYAKGISGVGDAKSVIEVEINDRMFKTTVPYLAFSNHFFNMYSVAESAGMLKDVRIYGDSLIKASAKIDIDGDKKGEKNEK